MAMTTHDDALDGPRALERDGVLVLEPDLTIVHHGLGAPPAARSGVARDDRTVVVGDEISFVVGDGISIVVDPPAGDRPEERAPILVDLTGRRSRVVRSLGLCATLATAGVLASLPVALVLPDRDADVRAGATPAITGVAFVDADCNGARSAGEPTDGTAVIELSLDGRAIATTRTRPDGGFALASPAMTGREVVRVVARSAPNGSTPIGSAATVVAAPGAVAAPTSTTAGATNLDLPVTPVECANR